jgi:hypothetical protein
MSSTINSLLFETKVSLEKKYGYQLNTDIFLADNNILGLVIKREVIVGLAILKYIFLAIVFFNTLIYFTHDFGVMYVVTTFLVSIFSVFLGVTLGMLEIVKLLIKSLNQFISSAYTFTTNLLNDAKSQGFTSRQFAYDFCKSIMTVVFMKGVSRLIKSEFIQNKVANVLIKKTDTSKAQIPLQSNMEDSKSIEVVSLIKKKLEFYAIGSLKRAKKFFSVASLILAAIIFFIILI